MRHGPAEQPRMDEASRGALWRLTAALRAHRGKLGVAVALGTAQHGLAIAAAALGATLVALAADPDRGDLSSAFTLLLVVVLALGLVAWIKMWFEYELANRVLAVLRTWLYGAFVRLAPAGLAGRHSGELASAAMADIARVDWFFARLLPALGTAALVPTAGLLLLAWLDPLSALVLGPFVAAVASIPLAFRAWARRQGDALHRAHTSIHADILDAIGGLREILAFGQGDAWIDRIDRRSLDLQRQQIAFGLRAGLEGALTSALVSGGSTLVLALAARRIAAGDLAPELLLVVVILATAVFGPILAATNAASRLGLARASAERVADLLSTPLRVSEPPDAKPPATALEPTVAFDDVTFRYRDDEPDVLCGLNLTVRSGEMVALVGASGAGKSTCAHLLLRFFDPTTGSIRYGGRDLKSLPQDWLRAQIGFVSQDAYLFDDSMTQNIRLQCPEATAAAVQNAARRAQADAFIRELPEGYDTRCGERGAQLSGGQRQRIAIARALLPEPPLLIFDEATSHLDSRHESALHNTLAPLRGQQTVLLIAHRPATIALADRVVVLEGGRVVEEGPPTLLIARGGAFARLLARTPGTEVHA